MVRYGCLLGGKRLRPALLLLSARAVGTITADHLTLAAVVERIHTATLVHDDILDDAVIRRHMDTCNARWENEASVLLGDYLFIHSFYLASTLDSTYACRTIGKATNVVCKGKLRQIRSCNNFELSEGEYLEIIEAKTASLCACAWGPTMLKRVPSRLKSFLNTGATWGSLFRSSTTCWTCLGRSLRWESRLVPTWKNRSRLCLYFMCCPT